MNTARVLCAGGIAFDDSRRLLVICRANPPGAGLWSVPGGKAWPGESSAAACVRELAEETGLAVRIERLLGRVTRPGGPGVIFDIDDYLCSVVGGELMAGDDASAARWVDRAALESLELVPGLLAALTEWGVLPDY